MNIEQLKALAGLCISIPLSRSTTEVEQAGEAILALLDEIAELRSQLAARVPDGRQKGGTCFGTHGLQSSGPLPSVTSASLSGWSPRKHGHAALHSGRGTEMPTPQPRPWLLLSSQRMEDEMSIDVIKLAEHASAFGKASRIYNLAETAPIMLERFAALVLEEAAKEADKRRHAGDAGPAAIADAIRALKDKT